MTDSGKVSDLPPTNTDDGSPHKNAAIGLPNGQCVDYTIVTSPAIDLQRYALVEFVKGDFGSKLLALQM